MALNSSFSDWPFFPSLQFFNGVFSNLKISNFNLVKRYLTWYVCLSKQARKSDLKKANI